MTARVAVATLGGAALLAVPASATVSTNDFRIVLDKRIGPYGDYLRGRYSPAVAAFGKPSSRGTEYQSNLCTVRWRRLGLDMSFVVDLKPCAASHLRRAGWDSATVHTRKWVVGRGVRVGDSVARLRQLYPHARFVDQPPAEPMWMMASVPGDGGPHATLTATTWGGRVTSISVYTGIVF